MNLVVVLAIATSLKAQEYKIPVTNSKDGKITLNDFMGELPIEGYSGSDIIVSITSGIVKPDQEELKRSKGLTPIYATGMDNTGIGLHMEKIGNQVTLDCLPPITRRVEYSLKIPDNFSVKTESGCERNTHVDIKNMKNELDIKNCQKISMTGVTGPLVLSTISGDIDVGFSNPDFTSPFSISAVSGDIDVTLPSSVKADLKMKTVTGNMYTDFDIPAANNENLKRVGGSTIEIPLNGGGVEFNLINVSGNIYLRKAR